MYEWIDNTYSWTDVPSTAWCDGSVSSLRGVYTDNVYLYFVSKTGLMIKDLWSDENIGYVTFTDGFTALAVSEEAIYLGTEDDGVMYLLKNTFNQNSISVDLTNQLLIYTQRYMCDSVFVRHLYYFNNAISVVTDVGVNILNNSLQGYKSTYNKIDVQKSIITSKLNLYYSYIEDNTFKLGKVINIKCDWTAPDIIYESDIFEVGAIINDFKITVNTTNGNDTIFVATSNGVYIICSKTKQFIKYNVINYSNNVISVNISKNASMVNGKLYITSLGGGAAAVYKIVDLTTLQTLDLYSFTFAGNAKTTLLSENLISSLLIGD